MATKSPPNEKGSFPLVGLCYNKRSYSPVLLKPNGFIVRGASVVETLIHPGTTVCNYVDNVPDR